MVPLIFLAVLKVAPPAKKDNIAHLKKDSLAKLPVKESLPFSQIYVIDTFEIFSFVVCWDYSIGDLGECLL